ncbi:uncharacterized protein BHQ10_007645 [Talaromyces amestolkiae]|uniref:Uncharacterized protein n=1 Tax=Talaromyces amestolkiae TaxID=1196081 RepID=A0A364L791_TALAM|nr:uncharacterized protein BHQ10_007645 [Talaromyces amestolkiae]RAO71633.1 hypothetical protein BHQ10_007645 [Talaromyces amestolkiae]
MLSPRISTPKIQPLTRQDGAKKAIRHIGQRRRHIFTECNHSIEDHHCMYPPKHTGRILRQNPATDTVVRFHGLCNNCEGKNLIRRAIVLETKRLVQGHMVGFVDETQVRSMTERFVRWAKNKLVVYYKYKKMERAKTIEDEHGDDEWDVLPVVVVPTASNPSRSGGYQWEEVYVEISSSPTLIHAQFDIQRHVSEFERKWNEPVRGSRGSRCSFANPSSETDLGSIFPTFPHEMLPEAVRALEDHYRYDDPDLLETLPVATAEDFDEEL